MSIKQTERRLETGTPRAVFPDSPGYLSSVRVFGYTVEAGFFDLFLRRKNRSIPATRAAASNAHTMPLTTPANTSVQ